MFDVQEANDRSPKEALEFAKKLKAQRYWAYKANVDHLDGLVLFNQQANWRFKTANCGEKSKGYQQTAAILELFGFGQRGHLMMTLSHGDDRSWYSFTMR